MVDDVRCALVARDTEPLAGTAPVAPTWLLVEDHGPWGRDALADGTLPAAVTAHLTDQVAALGVRYQAVRRPDRSRRPTRAVFLANVRAGWLARRDRAVEELVDLDLARVDADDPPPGWTVVEMPVVAVCTHGRRDACCALWGRPLATDLAQRGGDAVWETSHTGGHRFAPSILSFPSGAVHGFVADAAAFWADAGAGRLHLPAYRGNAGLERAAQAAEVTIRRRHDLADPADVTHVGLEVDGEDACARVTRRTPGGPEVIDDVALRRHRLPDGPTSCNGDPKPRATWQVVTP